MNLVEIDTDVFVNPEHVVAVEDNGYWQHSPSPSGEAHWMEDGSRLILRNGRKVYTRLKATVVIQRLKGEA